MLSVKRKGMVGQSKAAPAAQWMQFKKHSSQHHRWCSRAVVFFTRCQESKPANPLRLEAVCMFPSKFHWGLLCYLAHALHPAELKCSQLKVCWRQQLCCSKLEKAGKGKSWKGKVLWYCQKWSTSRPSNPLCSSHFCSLRSSSGNTKQIPLTSVWSTRQAVAEEDRQPVHDSFPPSLSLSLLLCLSLPFSLFYFCLYFSLYPSHSLKTEENKGRDRRKAI